MTADKQPTPEVPEDLKPRMNTYLGWRERMDEVTGSIRKASPVLRQLVNDGIELIQRIAVLTAQVAALKGECEQRRTWGSVEIAVRNPSVMEYMNHGESRATKAEAECERLRAPVSDEDAMLLVTQAGKYGMAKVLTAWLAARAESKPPAHEQRPPRGGEGGCMAKRGVLYGLLLRR
jgi:hypothetical protein